jgi:serine/threonine protein kinase
VSDQDPPAEVQATLEQLSDHYGDFEPNFRGANGYLYFARNRITGAAIAIKFYAGAPGDARHDEPRQLSAIRSANVLSILDAKDVSAEWAYFITPRCFEGDLDDLIATAPSAHIAIDTALGICNGVSAIHSLRMLHRDLKPGNIVMQAGSPQIADFGSVRALSNGASEVSASQHSILFRPPESFATGQYGFAGDIYQIGLVTYQLLGGALPYDGENYLSSKERRHYDGLGGWADKCIFVNDVIRSRAETGKLLDYNSLPPWVNGAAKRVLRTLTNIDPMQRPGTVAEVAALLTQMRAAVSNWQWEGEIAVYRAPGRVVEVRPLDEEGGLYQAYLSKDGGAFRRQPGLASAPLKQLVANIT